nr:hypothetical protein Iba_chr09bCG11510 [Ipomoea batatas]
MSCILCPRNLAADKCSKYIFTPIEITYLCDILKVLDHICVYIAIRFLFILHA